MTSVEFEFSEDLDNTRFHCGIDVHKHQITIAIIGKDDSGYERVVEEIFATTTVGLAHFWGFVSKYKPVMFSLEATNVYHHVVVTFLDEKKKDAAWEYSIIIASPPDVSGIPGRQKHDIADAKALARYAAAGLLKSGHEVNVPMEDMRALFRSALQVEMERTRLKNRIKKTLDRGGFRPIGLDFNANWSRDFVYQLTNHDGTIGTFYDKCVGKDSPIPEHVAVVARNKPKLEPFFDIKLSPGQLALVRQEMVELEFKTTRKAMLSVEIDRIICSRPGLRQKICNISSVPGISPYSAAWLVAEIGDITRFSDVRPFLAYCGCCPRIVSSDKTVYSSHITRKSNKYIRTMLYNAAMVVSVATKRESALKAYADRVVFRKRHRGMKLAFTIIAAKMVRIIYAIMRDGTCFSPDLAQPHHPAIMIEDGLLTITDLKLLRRARNVLGRVGTLEQLKGIAKNATYFADALDRVLRKN
ncbi:MAG: IS110 family transposase [Candidatus Lokiarchaeota archaeon]|nr:IS110 family transposase [Candidatus Lokiarchaeota archaeon]